MVLGTRIITSAIFVVIAIAGITFSLYLIYVANNVYMFFVAALFAVLSVVSGFFNIFTALMYYRSYFYDTHIKKITSQLKPVKRWPTIAVIMPVYNEDVRVVEKNLLRLKDLKYEKGKIKYYLGDDSTNPEMISELYRFCKKHGIVHVRRGTREGFKAGNVNNVLKISKEEYVAIFDYDEYVTDTNFLIDLIPYFNDKKLAYVQTEKSYIKGKTLFSDSIALFDAFFFKFIQQARALNNTAIFAGSCGIVKKSALDAVGGFPQYMIEDTFFSFESDMHGYNSIYVPKVYAIGKPLTTFTQLAKQQWRYNYGDTQFLRYFYKYKNPKRLTPLSNIDYVTHGFGLNYISLVLLLFTVVSVLIVFSAVPLTTITLQNLFNINANYIGVDLEIIGSFAFALSLVIPVVLTKLYFKSIKKGIMILMLNFALVVIRTKAALSALFTPPLKLDLGKIWSRYKNNNRNNLTAALASTRTEIALAAGLAGLAGLAFLNGNLTGSIWLFWYAALYSLATIFFYRYG